ncbi:L,D-transpeptidase [Limimaricola hongkongensis]|uniref:ErfK/YbiS/YcfS/YnhG family protein/Tat domain protein n=1 Tax=Limimaricola hongkongensis DSM 17492 TaxID=1122180 RepID=A0A017HCX6_9RHOB|nr:L,D-transpeptidase [Limimaricola hongkongensis]EYD72357.1 ErfK/YbiS/YcfS/YnhG family protein/Tat domain protein [Limimaricola hongkongensis DSM 17492]
MSITRRSLLLAALATPLSRPLAAQQRSGLLPTEVRVHPGLAPGDIYVIPEDFHLYHIRRPGVAMRYGVGVGRAGLEFKGAAVIQRKAEWPSWRPTDAMIAREPDKYAKYADGVPGGPDNPMGARALYLYRDGRDTYYRIHGTTNPETIGSSVSNGCIRLRNEDVMALYDSVSIGSHVTVV